MSCWERIRVLCVDDDRESASFTADRLERADSRLTVDTATGARSALARLADSDVDCVVSSYQMSGQTGVELLESVREEYPALPFLLFTGEGSEAVASDAISAGVTDYVRADSGTDWHETLADRIAGAVETDRTATRQRRIGRAVETTQTGVAVLNERLEFVEVDETYADVFRYDPDTLVGSPLWRLYSEDEAERAERSVSSALREDGHWHGEITVRRADGQTPVADHVVSATDGRRYVCLVCEVTDERANEGRLEQEQWRFRTLFEQLTRPLAEVEYDGLDPIVRRVNPAFERTFGCDAADIVGDPLDEHVVPTDGRQEAEEINRAVRRNGQVVSREVTRQTADGPREFLLENAVYENESCGFVIYADITEQKKRERAVERQNERLKEFTGVVSHDLRNPLSVAEGRLSLARKRRDSEHLRAAADAVDWTLSLIDDLLTLARKGDRVGEPESVALADTAEGCWRTVETAEATLAVETEQTIQADHNRLRQLLGNLFRNAVEHGGETVQITVGELNDGFYVADDGPGIPDDDRDRVFEVGYSTRDGNTGFGLNIVQEIVQAHGWEVRVTDGAAGGARFEITSVPSAVS